MGIWRNTKLEGSPPALLTAPRKSVSRGDSHIQCKGCKRPHPESWASWPTQRWLTYFQSSTFSEAWESHRLMRFRMHLHYFSPLRAHSPQYLCSVLIYFTGLYHRLKINKQSRTKWWHFPEVGIRSPLQPCVLEYITYWSVLASFMLNFERGTEITFSSMRSCRKTYQHNESWPYMSSSKIYISWKSMVLSCN